MKKLFFIVICLLCFLTLSSSTTNACSCGDNNIKTVFSASDAVFIGKVVKTKTVKETTIGLYFRQNYVDLKTPLWDKDIEKVRSVTLQVIEPLKGLTEKTFTLTSPIGGANCEIQFKAEQTYLVFARKTRPINTEETDDPEEKRLAEEANKLNKHLPFYETDACAKTYLVRS